MFSCKPFKKEEIYRIVKYSATSLLIFNFNESCASVTICNNENLKYFLSSWFLDRAHNVTIHNKNKQLRADSQHEFTCEALGSRPAAVLTWWLDEEQFEPQFNKVQIVSIPLDLL